MVSHSVKCYTNCQIIVFVVANLLYFVAAIKETAWAITIAAANLSVNFLQHGVEFLRLLDTPWTFHNTAWTLQHGVRAAVSTRI